MGTFAALFQKKGAGIPDEKKEEFKNRVEKLFRAGGMMELERLQLCDKKVVTIKTASMHGYGMDFYYNYFEDGYWENAGFHSKSGRIWSEKIGWREFHQVVVAAYVLESFYLDGPAIAMVNGELVTSNMYTGWINYLFQEHYRQKNSDPWALFEAIHDQMAEDLDRYDWGEFVGDIYGLIGYYEIRAVMSGTAATDEEFDKLADDAEKDEKDDKMNFFDFIKKLKIAVSKYHEESERGEAEQLSLVMEMLRSFYGQENISLDSSKQYGDKNLEIICFFVMLADAPAYAVKVIAETYGVDFWELWEQVKDVAKRLSLLYTQEIPQKAISVSTMDFFDVTSDDMIPFWGDDENIQFSLDLKEWFSSLKNRFEKILKTENIVENPLCWVLDLMEYADENYYHIYTFSDFFKETIEHLNDKRFIALWKIYDDMLHDPELEEAGNVIFVPEGPEYEHVGLHYFGTPPRRRLKTNWEMIKKEEKNNRARVTFRRYMALLGNRKLRKEVFGF